jgi:Flp pilus assembly protein TadG
MSLARLRRCRRGTALIEFAIVLPLLICLLFGIVGYGQYFLLAHSVQQIANDAARATIAGLSTDERRALAEQRVAADVASMDSFPAALVTARVAESGDSVTVDVTLDARGLALFSQAIVPMPGAAIERRVVVLRGGLS